MCANIDGTASALVATDGPELLECCCAVDGGLVGPGAGGHVVDGPVEGDGALCASSTGRIVCAEILNDVILDKGAPRPSIYGEIRVAVILVGTAVVQNSRGC